MRITAVSDLHLDARTGGMARHDDIEEALFDAALYAEQYSDLFLCLGDLTDPDSGSCVFQAMRSCIEVTRRLSIPSIWIAGNHDVIEDGSGQTTLEPLKPLGGNVMVIDQPGLYYHAGIEIFALPFTAFAKRYSPKKAILETDRSDNPRLVLGHLNVKGAQPGDEADMPRGPDVWLPVKELTAAFPNATILNGHIHRRQITADGVHIPGSLERLRFDEERHQPGWLTLEIPE